MSDDGPMTPQTPPKEPASSASPGNPGPANRLERPLTDLLVTRALAGTLSPDDAASLGRALAADPLLRAEFKHLEGICRDLDEQRARGTPESTTASDPVPVERLNAAVRQGLARSLAAGSRQGEGRPGDVAPPAARPRLGRWPRLAFAFGLLVLGAGLLFLYLPSRPPTSSPPLAERPAAYVIVERKPVRIERHGVRLVPASVTELVFPSDILHLEPESSILVAFPHQTVTLTGKGTTPVADLLRPSAPGEPRNVRPLPASSPDWERQLAGALFEPFHRLDPTPLLLATRDAGSLTIYTPRGTTAQLRPTVIWKAEAGTRYAVRITDELNRGVPPWQVSDVTPPLDFSALEGRDSRPLAPDGLYRLRIQAMDSLLSASETTFRTRSTPESELPVAPPRRLNLAREWIQAGPERVGDALALLLTLPAAEADSELAWRLKLVAFGQLGQREAFQQALDHLRRLGADSAEAPR